MKPEIFFIFLLALFSCKNEKKHQPISEKNLLILKNYKTQHLKINDSIEEVNGENLDFKIAGKFNTKSKRKIGWWKVSNKTKSEYYEFEFHEIKPENFNQMRLYKNGKLMDDSSFYYEIKENDKQVTFLINFPKDIRPQNAQVTYYSDDGKTEKQNVLKKGSKYVVNIPKKRKEDRVVGFLTEFTQTSVNSEEMYETQTLYFQNKPGN